MTGIMAEPVWAEDMDVVLEPETSYMQWLVEQLVELRVEDDIIFIMRMMTVNDETEVHEQDDSNDECLRNVQCPGNCDSKCVASWESIQGGNILQGITDSTLDECIRSVHCPGDCMGSCGDGTTGRIVSRDGSPYARQAECHTKPGTVTATQTIPGWKSNQDWEGVVILDWWESGWQQ